jgi:hypothetical protein
MNRGARAQRGVGVVSPIVGDSSDTSRDNPSTVLKATTLNGSSYSPEIMLRTRAVSQRGVRPMANRLPIRNLC